MTKINIKYNKFLDQIFKVYAQTLPQFKDWKEPTPEEIGKRVREFREAWKPIKEKVIRTIENCLGKEFPYSIVDVAIVSACPRPFSNPIVIGSHMDPDEFVCRLIHELIHKTNHPGVEIYKGRYPEENDTVLNHIHVHALLQHIYVDILDRPDLFELNKKLSQKNSTSDYTRAWEIVEKEGYENILSRTPTK